MKYDIAPVAKPRMTRRDKRGDKRPCVARYHAFKDECKLKKVEVPESGAHITFYLPMPKSWSEVQKTIHMWEQHQQKPDVDNLLKALLDACYLDDSSVWDVRVTKRWTEYKTGWISIET